MVDIDEGEQRSMTPENGFRRVLTLRHLVAFGLAYLAPTVVFNYYGVITDLTDGMMALAYVITLIAMFFTAYSYAHMVRAFPVSGSAYSYVRKAVNPWLGFGTGWVMLLDYLLLPMICYLFFGIYMNEYVPAVPVAVWVIASACFGAAVNIAGVKISGRLNVVLVSAQALFCLTLIGLITAYVLNGHGSGTLVAPQAIVDATHLDWGNMLWAASLLSVSFLGFDAVSTLAEETQDPRKTVPRGILVVCVGAGFGFAVVSYFLQIAWPNASTAMEDPDLGIFELLPRVGGEALSNAFLVTDQTASILAAMAAIAAVSRILYGMGRDHVLPARFFGQISPRFGTPVNNILLTSAIALTAVFYSDNVLGAASLTSFGAITGFVLVNFSVISHYFIRGRRRSGPDIVRFLVLPAIGMIVNVVLWINIDMTAKLLGLGWLTLGVIYLAVVTKGFRRLPQPILDEEEEPAVAEPA